MSDHGQQGAAPATAWDVAEMVRAHDEHPRFVWLMSNDDAAELIAAYAERVAAERVGEVQQTAREFYDAVIAWRQDPRLWPELSAAERKFLAVLPAAADAQEAGR